MNSVLRELEVYPMSDITELPLSSILVPRDVFDEYHLEAFNCNLFGEFLEITRFVVQDKGQGHGSRLLADLDEWAKERGLRLCLSPVPYYDISIRAHRRLIAFYMRNGFVFAQEEMNCPEAMYKP